MISTIRVLLAGLFLALAARDASAFEAGASKVEITPPLGTPLNGYYDRLGRGAIAIHDPVWVRCLYISDGETSVYLLNADLCIINRELRDRVLELAPSEVPREHIILTATHTHSAQGAMNKSLLARSITGRFMPDVLEATAQHFVEAMQSAYANRKRATIGYGTINQDDLSENRQVKDGPIDLQIGVIRVDDSDGNAIAIVSNFAAHPTTVGGVDQFSVSADYAGFYYDEVERLASPGCVAMFMNGAEGNQRCANPEKKSGWARTESIGKLLAERTMKVAGAITCGEAKLHAGYATPTLPPTIASDFMPSQTTLMTLEIDDLLVTFFPGEPCVEIGKELRRQALARGYKNQFSVGLANDHLLYFVPHELYGDPGYESAMSMYGPRMDQWFYRQFGALMTRGKPEPDAPAPSAGAASELGTARKIDLVGEPYQLGYQRGAALKDAMREAYQAHVVAPCDSGAWIPDTGLWAWAPPFVNQTPLALPRLAIAARPLLTGLPPQSMEELEGVADGAGLPFDAVWLTQCAPMFAAVEDKSTLYRSPFCTMVAVTGDRAGADDCLVGRNFDWSVAEPPVVANVRPVKGHRFVDIGFAWTVGVYTGMNDAGLVVLAERVENEGEPSLDGPPLAMVLREALQTASDPGAAEAILRAAPALRGYHVLLAGPKGDEARVLELGKAVSVRGPEDGLLLGVNPNSDKADDAAAARYNRMTQLIQGERIVSVDEMASFLKDREPGRQGRAQILNDNTRLSVVFQPRARRLLVSFVQPSGELGPPQSVSLQPGDSK